MPWVSAPFARCVLTHFATGNVTTHVTTIIDVHFCSNCHTFGHQYANCHRLRANKAKGRDEYAAEAMKNTIALAGAVPSVGPSLAAEEQSVDQELGDQAMAVEDSPPTGDLT